ncbi:MAG TPA: FKBP-type peptidyl-prolyl cis-trans isomerase [Solirubrobacterales bacterium]
MRPGLAASALGVVLLVGGCGGEDGTADKATSAPSTSESNARPAKSEDRPPEKRPKPIVIRVGGRTFKRAEPRVVPPQGAPPSDLIVENLIAGAGKRAEDGDVLTVEYVGVYYDDGGSFTNSWERSKPFDFELGGREPLINPGWEKGLKGMRVGERRKLIVPPRYLYQGGAPPGSDLDTIVYVVDLLRID